MILNNRIWRLAAASTVTLYAFGIACAQLGPNLVTNGSFEIPIGNNWWGSNPSTWFAGQIFGGWTVTQGSVDIVRSGVFPYGAGSSYDGVQILDLNGTLVGGIRQDITIADQGIYRLRFALTGNTAGDPDSPRIVRVQLSLGATDAFNSTFTWNLSDHPNHNTFNLLSWDVYQVDFLVPTAGIYTLSFTSLTVTNDIHGPMVDDVRLQLVLCTEHNGDVDDNGCVDDADLLQVLFAFGSTGSNLERVDVNCDEVVDDADLLIVLFNFGSGC
jgi:hypothetical protein